VDTPERKWSFTPLEGTSEAVTDELETFIKVLRLDEIAPGRFSSLLVLCLFGGFKAGTLDPHRAVLEIQALEMSQPSVYKDPVQNKRPPLAGLWHKHYGQLGLGPLAKNIQNALAKYKIPYLVEKVRQAQASGEERFFTVDDAAAIANDAVHGNYTRREEANGLTGEWIIFARHEQKNYYLSLATHDSSTHAHIRQQIDALCVREFPFLKDVLTS
jgi:hypothetical protein